MGRRRAILLVLPPLLGLLSGPAMSQPRPPATAADRVEQRDPVLQPEQDWQVDGRGRRFRIRFDPGSRLWLGAGAVVEHGGGEAFRLAPQLHAGLGYRAEYLAGEGDERIRWQLDHQALAGWVQPWTAGLGGVPSLEVVGYRGVFLRTAASSTITIPTSPPRRLYFPSGLGAETWVGRLRWPGQERLPAWVGLDLGHAAILFDPWRSNRPGCSLELGLGARYSLDLRFSNELQYESLIHRVAPFTALSARFRIQDQPGLTVLDLRGELLPHWASAGSWWLAGEAVGRLERVILALNDEPVALFLELSVRGLPGLDSPDALLYSGVAGLAWLFQLK